MTNNKRNSQCDKQNINDVEITRNFSQNALQPKDEKKKTKKNDETFSKELRITKQ